MCYGRKTKKIITKIVYASETGAKLDSNVISGGGQDVTEVIQAALNSAANFSGLYFIMDGAALVRELKVYSNTTIECLNKDLKEDPEHLKWLHVIVSNVKAFIIGTYHGLMTSIYNRI
jgi:hypothetical protein